MFDAKRVKLIWILAICGMMLDGPASRSFAQEASSGGFRSAMNRFLGVKPRAQSESEDQASEVEEEPASAPEENQEPPARNSRVRQASGQKGLFSGGLFHQLRSVTGNDGQEQTGDDVNIAHEEQAVPASRHPAVEPFSKPAVPPSAAYGSSAVGSSPARSRSSADLPKVVRPQEYLNRSLPNAAATASKPSSTAQTAVGQGPDAATSGLRASDINRQQESLDSRKSSRRARTSADEGSKVVSVPELPRSKLDSDTLQFAPTLESIKADQMPSVPSLESREEFASEAPSVAHQSSARAAAARPEFVVTSRQSQSSATPTLIAQAPAASASTAQSSAAEAKSTPAALPDPISLPPSSLSETKPNTSVSNYSVPSFGGSDPQEPAPSVPRTNRTASAASTPLNTTLPNATNNVAAAPKTSSSKVVAPPSSGTAKLPASSSYAPPQNFNSPLKDLASQSNQTASKQAAPAKTNSTPQSSAANTGSSLPNSLYSQVPPASASGPAAKVAQNGPPASSAANAQAAPSANGSTPGGALMEMSIPELHLWVEGPDKLRVDRPATYRIFAKNAGQNGVVGLLVSTLIPPGVTAKDMKGSAGTLEGEKLPDTSQSVLWQLPELPPGQVRELSMELSAAKPENFGLEIEWTVLPQSGAVELQSIQPQLLIGLEGPSEAMYGKAEIYKLHVRNPGNAPVEDVDVSLTADSFGTKEAKIGTIASGDERTVEVELTFKQAGELSILAGASSATTGLTAKSDIKVNVSQVKLESACRIPERQYQGAFASYVFSIENVGDVAAQQSVCEVALPPDTVVAQLPQGVRHVNNALVWDVGALQPHSENSINVELQLNALGEQPLAMLVKNDHGDASKCEAKVTVESISDLKLTVVDPVAPAPVSENVNYELVIHNRGSQPARNVAVLAQFSDGIEPISVSAENAEVVPGQVVFQPIAEIGPGEKLTLVITANASSSGMHRFRAEVQCDGGETHLVQEESTRFLTTAARVDSTTLKR
jgi:hypothetical protein